MKFYGIEMDGPMLLETLTVLPEFNPDSDKGRLVYINTIIGGALYYGSETQWERLLINDDIGTAIDEIDDHINDFNNPHNVTTGKIGATPIATHNAHVANQNDPHNTINLIQTQLVPPGAVFHFARSTAPAGYLICNGAVVSRSTYANLFAVIGTAFGAGNGSTTFGLPNLLGEFIRGWDAGRGVDSGRGFGTLQGSNNLSHNHDGLTQFNGTHTHVATTNYCCTSSVNQSYRLSGDDSAWNGNVVGNTQGIEASGNHQHYFVVNNSGANESRPRNIALLPCIKF